MHNCQKSNALNISLIYRTKQKSTHNHKHRVMHCIYCVFVVIGYMVSQFYIMVLTVKLDSRWGQNSCLLRGCQPESHGYVVPQDMHWLLSRQMKWIALSQVCGTDGGKGKLSDSILLIRGCYEKNDYVSGGSFRSF